MADESQSRCINEVLTFKQQVPAPPSASRPCWLSGPRDGARRGAAARSTRAAAWRGTRAPLSSSGSFLTKQGSGSRGLGARRPPCPVPPRPRIPPDRWHRSWGRFGETEARSRMGALRSAVHAWLYGESERLGVPRGFCGVGGVGGQEEGFGGHGAAGAGRGASAGPVPLHRADRRRSGAVRGGESSSVAINLISISCLTMEKWHVVRGSKNRLSKLLTAFADVKGKTGASRRENTPWPCLGGVHPGPSGVGSSRPRGGGQRGRAAVWPPRSALRPR